MSDEARTPKVVVVMPAYNAGRTLRMTYEELPKDTVSMVILVDDGSTDTTLEIARQLGLEIFVHNRNYGYGANQKTCYAEALRAGADALLPRGVVGGVRRLHDLRPPDPGRPLLVHAPPPGPPALAAFRQPARQVHPPAVTVLARPLDALAAGVLLLAVLVVATGGFTVRGLPINRPEDLLVVLATVVALRGLVAPIALPRVRPARAVAAGVGAYALLMGFVVGSRHAAAFDARRYGWCAFALLLTLGGREDAAIAVVGFGLWLALARRRWALGVTVLAASVLVLLIDLTWVMPYFRGSPYPHLGRYSYLGASLPEILVTLVARPWRWAPVMLTLPKLAYLAAMLAPLGFLPLLAPRALAAALPGLPLHLLSLDPVLFNYRSQYQSFVLPFFVLASVDGYARLRQWRVSEAGGGGGAPPLPSRLLSPTAVLAFGFLASAVLTARTVNDFMVTRWWPNDDRRAAGALMREIPADVAVSVNERLVPHLATRREVYIFPTGVDTSRFILDRVGEVEKTPPAGFTLHHREDGWVLLRRGD